MLLALFDRRSNRQGTLAGMITGAAMIFIWKFLIAPMGGAWAIYELLPAFLLALIVNLVVSRLTPAADAQVLKTYDQVSSGK
jgi:sodium/proline symporter